MAKFRVEISEVVTTHFDIEAESLDEALADGECQFLHSEGDLPRMSLSVEDRKIGAWPL